MNATQNGSKNKSAVNVMAALERIRANPKITLIISTAAAISIGVALLFWARTPDYRMLYSNISDRDGGAVVAQLDQMQIPYRFEHGGTLMVPADKVYEVRLKLAQQGLPKGGEIGFELLDQEKFGISQFSEQVNFQRALEGELSRTIETLGPVQKARVHLAIPKPSLFVHEQKSPTASVTLNLNSGRTLDAGQVNAIAWLISSAVPGLAADKVTILDQSGHLLSQSGGQAQATTNLKYTSDIEADYQRRIQAILAPILGGNNVRVQVTAQMDFTTHEQTAEQYQPNTSPDHMSVRSRQSSHSEQGGKRGVGGVPGALSNQPPVPAVAPLVQNADAANATAPAGNTPLVPFNTHKDEVTNYELDRTLTHIKRSTGTIERLSVAVVVNYKKDKDNNDIPLTQAQLDQVNALVKEVMGFSEKRGDTVHIVNSAFQASTDDEAATPFWKQPAFINLMLSAGRYLLVALVCWLLWRKAVKPAWLRQQAFIRERLELERQIRQADLDAKKTQSQQRENAKAQQRIDTEVGAQQLRDVAEQEPQLIALVIRQWMNKEQTSS